MTEAFGFERREPLDDGVSAETVERAVAVLHARAIARCGANAWVGLSMVTGYRDVPHWSISVYAAGGREIARAREPVFADTVKAVTEAFDAAIDGFARQVPTEPALAATLGIEAENGGIR